MIYSYTQISQYLTCPRRYRHRYLDGWQEKDVRAAMLFGRCFEQAVAALFRHEDPAAVLFEQWTTCKDLELVYSGNDTWDHMFQQGIQLLERFTQEVTHPPRAASESSLIWLPAAPGEAWCRAVLLYPPTAQHRYPTA
jgi:PD-(D/E)XK nuclease superfamily